ncbi:MAG: S-methyl-5-thioribose-1-phosphate isomerase, partial [Desulfovibrio sp.]|nr:S-methyl-5-thioribose-1-phosphate isomerase [Desulfovibrio sp.]
MCRRDVEGEVVDRHAVRSYLRRSYGRDFQGRALFYGNGGARGRCGIDGGDGGCHVEGDAEVPGQQRHAKGAYLVGRVAVGRDAVCADHHALDKAPAHEQGAGVVAGDRHRNAVLGELPGGEPRPQQEDIDACKAIGRFGLPCVHDNDTILTHCNAGALATAGYGTALGVVRAAFEHYQGIKVIADETRPFLQGARLTAWELAKDGIPVTVACDNACALLMSRGLVQCVVVGADRIAANGDAANKIGTFGVALLARHFGIPFYVAAPV